MKRVIEFICVLYFAALFAVCLWLDDRNDMAERKGL